MHKEILTRQTVLLPQLCLWFDLAAECPEACLKQNQCAVVDAHSQHLLTVSLTCRGEGGGEG